MGSRVLVDLGFYCVHSAHEVGRSELLPIERVRLIGSLLSLLGIPLDGKPYFPALNSCFEAFLNQADKIFLVDGNDIVLPQEALFCGTLAASARPVCGAVDLVCIAAADE